MTDVMKWVYQSHFPAIRPTVLLQSNQLSKGVGKQLYITYLVKNFSFRKGLMHSEVFALVCWLARAFFLPPPKLFSC